MTERDDLRAKGHEVLTHLQHGSNPPRPRPLYLGSIPGMDTFNAEALWGSVWARPGLDRRFRMIATIAILSSLQRLQQLRTYFNSALNIGLDAREIREIVIQCSVYAGFPTTVNSLELLRDVLEARGIEAGPMDMDEVTIAELDRRGGGLADQLIGGDRAEGDGDPFSLAAKDLWQVEMRYVFGELYHRPGTDLKGRVVCAIASLLAVGPEEELARWLRGAGGAGISDDEVAELLMHGAYYAGFPAAQRALDVASRVLGAGADTDR
jgi:4-carboxymuconolactone decarboxylase